jgi:LacI family transcriptional regulator
LRSSLASKKPKNVTLRRVAELAGVSPATASLVVNGKGEISEPTRQRFLRAAAELHYAHGASRTKQVATSALRFLKIAKHGHTGNGDHSHFISDYIDGMSFEAGRRDYNLQVTSHEAQEMSEIFDTLSGSDMRGIVGLGTELTADDILCFSRLDLPTVFIDTYHAFIEANLVDMDNDQAVFQPCNI